MVRHGARVDEDAVEQDAQGGREKVEARLRRVRAGSDDASQSTRSRRASAPARALQRQPPLEETAGPRPWQASAAAAASRRSPAAFAPLRRRPIARGGPQDFLRRRAALPGRG